MKFSSLQEISACESTACLLDQSSVAKVSKINDCIKSPCRGVDQLFRYAAAHY